MNHRISVVFLILLFCIPLASQTGTKKKRPLPYDYGRVVISNYSESSGQPPVVFQHWIHRSMFTCRVCHVDIGFGMKANSTNIRAVDVQRGFYCGACHNGHTEVNGKKVFAACTAKPSFDEQKRCERCHSMGRKVQSDFDFFTFSAPLPKERFGNGIDWEKSEEMGLIKPAKVLEGFTIPKNQLVVQKDFDLNPKVEGMPDIIFSHKKHTVWNGCELCHPDIFMGVKKGNSHYTMVDISEGKSCGACHVNVAFPLTDCQRCHSKPVGEN
ncbi:MAG: cytochrome c3 family protein [Acidobacteriota bacterium]|nr:cytochrome c3 family protein [Acidobacteriota bacterium]